MSSCDRLSQASCTCCRNSTIWTGSHCRHAARWMVISTRRNAAHFGYNVSVWVVAFSSGLWKISTSVDQVLNGRVLQTHVKIDAMCKQRWTQPGKKYGHMLHLLYHHGPLGTVYLQQDSGHLQHDTIKHCYSGVVKMSIGKWNGALLSSVMSRFCLYSRDGRIRVRHRPGERHLPECIRPRQTGPTSGFMCGGHQFQLALYTNETSQMAEYTLNELADMHLLYGETCGNNRGARRLYPEKFPLRRLPSHVLFQRIDAHMRETGHVGPTRRGAGRPGNVRRNMSQWTTANGNRHVVQT